MREEKGLRKRCGQAAAMGAAVCTAAAMAGGALVIDGGSAGASSPPGSQPPATWVNCPSSSLQTAIDSAEPGSVLIVRGTCRGDFTIGKDLTLIGSPNARAHRAPTVLDGQHAGTTLSVSSGVSIRLMNVTVTDGAAQAGAGIANRGVLSVFNTSVEGNTAEQFAGGIVNYGMATVSLHNTSISDNAGGGLINFPGGTVTARGISVTDNNAMFGGGIANGGSMMITQSRVSGNTALIGAGIDNDTGATLTLGQSVVTDNTASGYGGGIYNLGSVTLRHAFVVGNTPDNCNPAGSVAGCSG